MTTEKALVKLAKLMKIDAPAGYKAKSMFSYYRRTGRLTKKQKHFIDCLIISSAKEKTDKKNYQLYAISDGRNLKIGFSCSPGSRLGTLQTGSPATLKIVWRLDIGKGKSEAQRQERKLHRFCKSYAIRGEWFKIGCMARVQQFGIKHQIDKRRQEEEEELEILFASNDKI